LILLDIQMPGLNGIDALPKFKDIDPSVIIIMTTALGSKDMIMEAIGRGAYDYFVKPFKMEEMEVIVKRSLERRRLEVELETLKEQVSQAFRVESIIGRSGAIQEVLRLVSASRERRLLFSSGAKPEQERNWSLEPFIRTAPAPANRWSS